MSRSGEASARLAALGAGVVGGDLTDSVALERCLREAAPTHVAHLAATSLEKSEKACKEVNVDGTRALIDTCLPLGLERFLFVSSVLRGQAAGETFTETDHIPATTALGRSKEAGDRMICDAVCQLAGVEPTWTGAEHLPSVAKLPFSMLGPRRPPQAWAGRG